MKIIKEKIEAILRLYPTLRDNDNKLICTVWLDECLTNGLSEEEARKVLGLFAEGKLSSPESIRRSRQNLQEKDPTLRGEIYSLRHRHTAEVRKKLGYPSEP